MKQFLKHLFRALGYQMVKLGPSPAAEDPAPVEFSAEDVRIVDHVMRNQLTMATRARLYATVMACKHVVSQAIPGDFVECGVWKGGNSLIAADVLSRADAKRKIYLFDTFAGMTKPSSADVKASDGSSAMNGYLLNQKAAHNEWCYAPLAEVTSNFADLNLLGSEIRFIEGDVIASLKVEANLPETISVLRLDTDWYESTRAELEILYPRLSPGGVIIIDDYGHWGGAKKAVDEFFSSRPRPLLQYTDYTGRMGIKPHHRDR